ncbi:kelch repeat protein [Pyrenophora tritici-repentis]|nr:kelch repeat protein [Pyrenophora tritici-repentis]KAI1594415.1 kelch repeat protein [Pyrenophora tritici-repentis]
MYIFSGRGGVDMAPVEEDGAVWCFNPKSSSWSKISPVDSSKPYPPARSYHCSTSDGKDTLFIHAGCPANGRLSDLWKFNIHERTWTQAPDAPAPHRGGASIAFSGGKLYRMNGFDGTTEQGGSIDIFDIASDTWTTENFAADGFNGPKPRSVCVLLPVKLAGKDKLLTLFGEHDPSSLGHAGAGKMLSDVWIYDVGEKWWTEIQPEGSSDGIPDPRGWFDADVVKADSGNDSIVIHGGLGENNERLADLWQLAF